MAKMTTGKTTKKDQWPDCSNKERAKVPGINLAIKDMANPCKLAKQYGVKLGQLRAYTVRDDASAAPFGERKNEFVIARKLTASIKVRSTEK